uniref:THO complex 5 n=1 Tax=Anas platyrhynchos platyrhynchos TaxID=8840 RepID=A0A493TM38_ANAPP
HAGVPLSSSLGIFSSSTARRRSPWEVFHSGTRGKVLWSQNPAHGAHHSLLAGAPGRRRAVLLSDPPLPSRQRPAVPGLPPELPVPGRPREEDPQPRQPVPVRQSGVRGLPAAAVPPWARAGGRRSPLPAGEEALWGGLTLPPPPPPPCSIVTLSDYVTELGHPYVWVQKLGGLHFPKEQPQHTVTADNSLSASHMELTVKLLRTRLQSRLALHKQFASLEHGVVPVSSECQHLFPTKIVSRLVKWSAIPFEDYAELPYTKDVVEAGLAEDTHLYYMALIERGTAKLQAAVVLNPGYSALPPIFSLCLNWKGERTGNNDDNIRAMESEVNVCYKELWGPKPGYQLLTNQLQRLCMVLDVYLETEPHDTSVEGPKEFPQEKMCLRLVR